MRLRLYATLLTASIATAAMAQTTTLADLRDKARPILIFVGQSDDVRSREQLASLASHAADLRERDMRVVVIGDSQPNARTCSDLPEASLLPGEQATARQFFHVGRNAFAVVLVGKDGGEQFHSRDPVPWQTIAAIVDGMPMRREEMKHK